MQNYYKYWEQCLAKIEAQQAKEAEEFALQIAKDLKIPQKLIDKIYAVNLKNYQKKIDEKLKEAISSIGPATKAICLYYSIDNSWESTLYICDDYSDENINWVGKSRKWIDAGLLRKFSAIYKKDAESAFFCDNLSSGILILLMFRTTKAFAEIAGSYKNCGVKLCITCTESDVVKIIQ
jgi:hypothetical protein